MNNEPLVIVENLSKKFCKDLKTSLWYGIKDLWSGVTGNKADVDAFLAPFADFFNDEILNKRKYLRDLSKGNSKKVGIIAALIGNPEVIILDEPFANLDPTTQIRLKRILKELANNPEVTILVSSHDLQHTVEVSNRIVVLEKGEVVKDLQTSTETMKELEAFFSGEQVEEGVVES